MKYMIPITKICTFAVIFVLLAYIWPVLHTGSRDVGVIENIYGIPYATQGDNTQITEELAHADIYLVEPAAFKELRMVISFDPQELNSLDVGIRENSFWLSYSKVRIYEKGTDASGRQTKEVVIPLTDKFQEPDRSLDMIFFASPKEPTWTIYDISAEVTVTKATIPQIKNYLVSVIKKERAQ